VLDVDEDRAPVGVSARPVISQSDGPSRKRLNVAAEGLAPTRVCTASLLPSARVYSRVCAPPSPTLPGMPSSIMQLVTSVYAPSSVWMKTRPVFALKASPSGLEKSWSPVSEDRLMRAASMPASVFIKPLPRTGRSGAWA
jgi:hypothetical protein